MSKSASYKTRERNELLKYRVMYDLNVAAQGIVKSYHESSNTADVMTAIDDKDGIDESVTVVECPVVNSALIQFDKRSNKPLYSPLKKGDKVLLIFDNRDMDNFTTKKGAKYSKASDRMHSINDAIVIGRYEVIKHD